jgi:hypothetical protein
VDPVAPVYPVAPVSPLRTVYKSQPVTVYTYKKDSWGSNKKSPILAVKATLGNNGVETYIPTGDKFSVSWK